MHDLTRRRTQDHHRMEDLIESKKQLYSSLGDEFKKYLQLLKLWFKGDLDKNSFDEEAIKILSRDQIKLHNKFLISLLSKCHSLVKTDNKGIKGSTNQVTKKAQNGLHDMRRFRPVSPSEYLESGLPKDCCMEKVIEYRKSLLSVTSCLGDSLLPDNFATHLRMFVLTWESGLDSLTDDSVTLINIAVREFVKNVITSVITFKKGCQTTESDVKHSFESSLDPLVLKSEEIFDEEDYDYNDMHIMNKPVVDDVDHKEVMTAFTSSEEDRKPLSLWDLFYALRKYQHCIPSHAIYSINLTRIMTNLEDSEDDESVVSLPQD